MYNNIKIAVPVTEDNQINGHFGQCDYYRVFEMSTDNVVTELRTIASEKGCGCKSNIASVLAENGVKVLLAGGIGEGAINVLNVVGIDVVRGCSGDATATVKKYFDGLVVDAGPSCDAHSEGHVCNH